MGFKCRSHCSAKKQQPLETEEASDPVTTDRGLLVKAHAQAGQPQGHLQQHPVCALPQAAGLRQDNCEQFHDQKGIATEITICEVVQHDSFLQTDHAQHAQIAHHKQ